MSSIGANLIETLPRKATPLPRGIHVCTGNYGIIRAGGTGPPDAMWTNLLANIMMFLIMAKGDCNGGYTAALAIDLVGLRPNFKGDPI